MAEQLIIWRQNTTRPDHGGDEGAHWLVLDAQGNRIGFPQSGALADAAALAPHRRVIILVPGEPVLLEKAEIPGRNPQKILQAAPYALEDRFATDVDELHVALLSKATARPQEFLIVAKPQMRQWLAECMEAGIKPDAMFPDYLALPIPAEGGHYAVSGSRLLARQADGSAFSAELALANALMEPVTSEAHLLHETESEIPSELTEAQKEIADGDALFTRLARAAAGLSGPGLLQGEFRVRRERAPVFKHWRIAAVLGVLWLTFAIADWGIEVWRLRKESVMLTQATERLFHEALPDVQRMVNPRAQIEERLKGSTSGSSPALAMIGALGVSINEAGKAQLNGFNFRDGKMEVSVTVPDSAALDRLREILQTRTPYRITIQSANSQEKGLEGRLLLEASGA